MNMASRTGIISLIIVLTYSVVSEDVTVETNLGNITGEVEELTFAAATFHITKFLGIPFAEPPTGSRRFHKPIEKGSFESTFVAKTMSAQCVQNWDKLKSIGFDPASVRMDEDCLYLNIFIPGRGPINKSHKLAVMIWIYGGDFQIGSQDAYDAKVLVGLNDVILVTLNYRVSFLGFLSSAENNFSGNYGLWDQHMAIKWVHNHIESFGGDPLKVTLFGESAGSASVIYQALFEDNSGLFQRVIAQSGSANMPWAYEQNPSEVYYNFVNKSGCLNGTSNAMTVINCLRNLSVSEITELVEFADDFRPVKDGKFVSIHPPDILHNKINQASNVLKQFGKLDAIIGVTSNEGGMFIPMIDKLTGTNETTKGYSREAFDNVIVPFSIKAAKLIQSRTLSSALIHQYFDWSEPDNKEKVFENTVDMISDVEFNNPITKTALAHSDTDESGTLFFYVFDHNSILSDDRLSGATHAEDIPFVLGFPKLFALIYTLYNITIPQNEIELSRKLMKYWTNFAKTGNPNSADLTTWPQYNSQTEKYIRFQADKPDFPVENHFAASRMNFWHNLIPLLEQECDNTCPNCDRKEVSRASVPAAWQLLLLFSVSISVILA